MRKFRPIKHQTGGLYVSLELAFTFTTHGFGCFNCFNRLSFSAVSAVSIVSVVSAISIGPSSRSPRLSPKASPSVAAKASSPFSPSSPSAYTSVRITLSRSLLGPPKLPLNITKQNLFFHQYDNAYILAHTSINLHTFIAF